MHAQHTLRRRKSKVIATLVDHNGPVKELRRLAVHIEAAVDSASDPTDIDRLRIALLLFDSAAELMLYRECEHHIRWAEPWASLLRRTEQEIARGISVAESELESLRRRAMSRKRIERVRREFSAKIELLVERNQLDPSEARVLRKLHEYRNEAYHRDACRPETVWTSVRVYGFLVFRLMERTPPHVMSVSAGPPPRPIGRLLGDHEPPPSGLDLQQAIGCSLTNKWQRTSKDSIAVALGEHARRRVIDLRETLAWVASAVSDLGGRVGWDPSSVLRVLQAQEGQDPRVPVEQTRAVPGAIELADLDAWEAEAAVIERTVDDIASFAAFADLEDAIEPIETLANDLARDVDLEIQHQVDVIRGR